jgi:hypothetical protein
LAQQWLWKSPLAGFLTSLIPRAGLAETTAATFFQGVLQVFRDAGRQYTQ